MKLGVSVSNLRNNGAHLKNISEEEKQERLKALQKVGVTVHEKDISRKESRFQDIIEAMEDYNKTTGATKPIPQKYTVPVDAPQHAKMKLGKSVSTIRNEVAYLKNISEAEKQERLKALQKVGVMVSKKWL